MTIEIRQKKSNIKNEFKIFGGDELLYTGKQAGYSGDAPNHLYGPDGGVLLESRGTRRGATPHRLLNLLFCGGVLVLWFGIDSLPVRIIAIVLFFFLLTLIPFKSKVCHVYDSEGRRVARFRHQGKGLLTAYDVIETGGREYRVYNKARSHFLYLSIYQGDTQIAQINKDLHTTNNRDNYTLYLPDEQAEMADLLTMFVLYYDSHYFGHHGEAFVGVKKSWSWSWSKTDRFYDETWLPSHFGWDLVEGPGPTDD